MLSLPEFKQKQILFINTLELEGKSGLKIQNDNLIYTKDDKIINKISCYKLFTVFIIGDFTFTSRLVQKAQKLGFSLFFLKRNFELYGSLNSIAQGNYLLRQKQYALSPDRELEIAKLLIANKISNHINLLKTNNLKHPTKTEIAEKIKQTLDSKSLLGLEGNFSKIFYQNYFQKINWHRRSPRAKEDIPNLLLDLGYTFLFNFIDSLLQLYGFDTYKGVYHKLFFQRKSLACDLMEPFRPLIDKQLLKSYNLGQIKTTDFKTVKGTVTISYKKISTYTKIFMTAIMDNKVEIHQYIQIYYYHILNDDKKFPKFYLR